MREPTQVLKFEDPAALKFWTVHAILARQAWGGDAVPEESRRGFGAGFLWGLGLVFPLALTIGLLGRGYIKLKRDAMQRGWSLVEVVVADQPQPTGQTLADHHLATRRVPEQMVTEDAVLASQGTTALGRRLRVPVARGQPMRWSFMEEPAADDQAEQAVAEACPPGTGSRLEPTSQTILSVQKALAEEASQ